MDRFRTTKQSSQNCKTAYTNATKNHCTEVGIHAGERCNQPSNPQYIESVEASVDWLATGMAAGDVTGMATYSSLSEIYGLEASVYCQKRVQF